jgi:hypothetical protein
MTGWWPVPINVRGSLTARSIRATTLLGPEARQKLDGGGAKRNPPGVAAKILAPRRRRETHPLPVSASDPSSAPAGAEILWLGSRGFRSFLSRCTPGYLLSALRAGGDRILLTFTFSHMSELCILLRTSPPPSHSVALKPTTAFVVMRGAAEGITSPPASHSAG